VYALLSGIVLKALLSLPFYLTSLREIFLREAYLCRMQFSSIIAQADAKQQLAELVQHNRLSHALLF